MPKSKSAKYAEVAPTVPLQAGRETYTYKLPADGAVEALSRVSAPFGKRTIEGVVVEVHDRKPKYALKTVIPHSPFQLTPQQVAFAREITRTMHGSFGYTLRLFFPSAKKPKASQAGSVTAPGVPDNWTPGRFVLVEKNWSKRMKELAWLCKKALREKEQVLIIVPEQWMVSMVAAELSGQSKLVVSEVHGGLTARQHTNVWEGVRDGETQVVVGTQKALYLPWRNLRAIILEEAAFHSHKLWDAYPRLDNRWGAPMLANLHKAALIYSSSFPAIGIYYHLHRPSEEGLRHFAVLDYESVKVDAKVIAPSPADLRHRYPVPHEAISMMRRWIRKDERVLVLTSRVDEKVLKVFKGSIRSSKPLIITAANKKVPDGEKLLVGTTAVFSALQDRKVDRIVYLFPESIAHIHELRSEGRVLTIAHRLQMMLPPRRKLVVVTRRPRIAEKLFGQPTEKVLDVILKERKRLGFPPFSDVVQLTIAGRSADQAWKNAVTIREQLEAQENDQVVIRGPFKQFNKAGKPAKEAAIVLFGPLSQLVPLYEDLAIASAEVNPERIR